MLDSVLEPHRGGHRPPRARRGCREGREDQQSARHHRSADARSRQGARRRLAENLERLYDYASRTLLKAHLENRVDLLKEVTRCCARSSSAGTASRRRPRPEPMIPLVATVIALTDRVQAAIDAGDWPRAQELETDGANARAARLGAEARRWRADVAALEPQSRLIGLWSTISGGCCAKLPSRAPVSRRGGIFRRAGRDVAETVHSTYNIKLALASKIASHCTYFSDRW